MKMTTNVARVLKELSAYVDTADQYGWYYFEENKNLVGHITSLDYVQHPLPSKKVAITGVTPDGESSGYLIEDMGAERVVWQLRDYDKPYVLFSIPHETKLIGEVALHETLLEYCNEGEKVKNEVLQFCSNVLLRINTFFELYNKEKDLVAFSASSSTNNKKRVAKGKKALFEWTKIDLSKSQTYEKGDHKGGTHASPRQHERRGHWRNLANGKTIWIKPMIVGNIENGRVAHMYNLEEAR